MKRLWLLALIPLSFGLIATAVLQASSRPASEKTIQRRPILLNIRGRMFSLEVADTDHSRAKGLSGRKELAADHGMLFGFSEPGYYEFWMKDTLIPLDIIWLHGRTIVDIKTLPAQLPGKPPEQYRPKKPADTVIELNAGLAEQLQLKVGEKI